VTVLKRAPWDSAPNRFCSGSIPDSLTVVKLPATTYLVKTDATGHGGIHHSHICLGSRLLAWRLMLGKTHA
jgi:hypothetical protein